MNTNDTLLTEMIKQDMHTKSITCFYMTDELAENPKRIKVGANEAVYVCYFSIKQRDPFTFYDIQAGSKNHRCAPG